MNVKSFILILFLLMSRQSNSQIVQARVTDYGWLDILPPLRTLLDDAVEDLESDINRDQPIRDAQRFLKGTANSTLLSGKGIGTDYANHSDLLIGVGLGATYDGEKDVALEDEYSGLGGASSIVIGARLPNRRFLAFLNYGNYSYGQTLPAGDIDIAGKLDTSNFGLHLRYDWIDGKGDEWLGWGGVKVNLGYEYSKNEIELKTRLNEELEIDTGQGVIRSQIQGDPRYEIESKVHSFPLEISSDVRFLKFFTLYGGLGADVNFGSATGKGKVSGDVNPLVCINGLCSTFSALPEVEVKANLDAKSKIKETTYRYFGGLQINFTEHLHVFGQGERLIGTEVVGVAVGLKYTN